MLSLAGELFVARGYRGYVSSNWYLLLTTQYTSPFLSQKKGVATAHTLEVGVSAVNSCLSSYDSFHSSQPLLM